MASLRAKGDGHEIVFTDRSRDPYQVYIYYGSDYSREELVRLKKRLEENYRWGVRDPWDLAKKSYNPKLPTAVRHYVKHKIEETEEWSSPHTLRSNKNIIERFGQMFSGQKLRDISTQHIDEFINQEGLARSTRKSYLRDVNTFLTWAKLDVADPPIRGTKQAKQIVYIREGEVSQLTDTISRVVGEQIEKGHVPKGGPHSLWLIDLLNWSFYSGMRPSEILQLRHEDYEPDEGVIHIRHKTKTSKPRTLPVGRVAPLKTIANNLTDPKVVEAKATDPYWKTDLIFGHRSVDNTSDKIKKYINLSFGPDRASQLSWYSFRHGCAVWLLSREVSIYSVADWMGHASVRTTEENYADIVPQDLGKHIGQAHEK